MSILHDMGFSVRFAKNVLVYMSIFAKRIYTVNSTVSGHRQFRVTFRKTFFFPE